MGLLENLTPKDAEEVKPGIFVQKKKDSWKVIHPVAWNGRYRTKAQLKSLFSIRTVVTLSILLFLVWSYKNDVSGYQNFYEEVAGDPFAFCKQIEATQTIICTEAWEEAGVCTRNPAPTINFSKVEVEEFGQP